MRTLCDYSAQSSLANGMRLGPSRRLVCDSDSGMLPLGVVASVRVGREQTPRFQPILRDDGMPKTHHPASNRLGHAAATARPHGTAVNIARGQSMAVGLAKVAPGGVERKRPPSNSRGDPAMRWSGSQGAAAVRRPVPVDRASRVFMTARL